MRVTKRLYIATIVPNQMSKRAPLYMCVTNCTCCVCASRTIHFEFVWYSSHEATLHLNNSHKPNSCVTNCTGASRTVHMRHIRVTKRRYISTTVTNQIRASRTTYVRCKLYMCVIWESQSAFISQQQSQTIYMRHELNTRSPPIPMLLSQTNTPPLFELAIPQAPTPIVWQSEVRHELSLCANYAYTLDNSFICYVTVCCSVLQCVAVCCSVLQWCSVLQRGAMCCSVVQCVVVCCSVLQCVAVCCSAWFTLKKRPWTTYLVLLTRTPSTDLWGGYD